MIPYALIGDLVSIVLLPSAAMLTFDLSSMAIGTFAASIVCLLFYYSGAIKFKKKPITDISSKAKVLLSVLLVFQCFAIVFFYESIDFFRYIISLTLLWSCVFGAQCFVETIFVYDEKAFACALRVIFSALFLSAALELLGFSIANYGSNFLHKPVFVFQEPSHFATAFLPFLLYFVISSNRGRGVLYIASAMCLAVIFENLTFIVGIFSVLLISFTINRIFILIGLLIALVPMLDLSYYFSRLNFSDNPQNLSTLVFFQGWQNAYIAVKNSFGLGIGFQQMGVFANYGDATEAIDALIGSKLSIFDGGSLAPKLIAEFGFLGLLLIVIYCLKALKIIKIISSKSIIDWEGGSATRFFYCCFLMFSMDIFVRGVGYFSGNSFLFICSIVYMIKFKK
jgi:hypothetical protein